MGYDAKGNDTISVKVYQLSLGNQTISYARQVLDESG
jgi:hypothetical protein